MKYAGIDEFEIANGLNVGISVYTQGCPHHCTNCFNPETWDFNGGSDWTVEEENKVIALLNNPYIKRLTILGGEPLIERNREPLRGFLSRVRELYPNKEIWLYTGDLYENIKDTFYDVIKYVDVLVDGEYVDGLRDITLKFRGSSNQRIIDVQKSLKENTIVKREI